MVRLEPECRLTALAGEGQPFESKAKKLRRGPAESVISDTRNTSRTRGSSRKALTAGTAQISWKNPQMLIV
jgi:hypothetical protein